MSQPIPAHSPVVVRFAPSPTGTLHIGGARTALFNWLYAKAKGGRFLLRIEDTDRARNSDAAVAAILDGLTWLGLDWDGDPVSQYSRAARHREVAVSMLASGHAYYCYSAPAEVDAAREAVKAENKARKEQKRSDFLLELFLSPWRDRDPSEAPTGIKPAVRLKAPRWGETVIEDQVQGRVVFSNKDLDDLVILRSDGSPTYNLAVVVDDHDMEVTHVIRGVDHLTNAARQSQIYAANGWTIPAWAHVPLIHGSDGAKLSKRHGAQGVEEYRRMGYLPEALRNYLVRLGWSHGDDEIMSTEQLTRWFDVDGVNKSAARFDFKKLDDLNAHYIRQSSNTALAGQALDMLRHLDFRDLAGQPVTMGVPTPEIALARHVCDAMPDIGTGEELGAKFGEIGLAKFNTLVPSLRERARSLCDIIDGALFLVLPRPLKLDEKAGKLLDTDGKSALTALLGPLEAILPAGWNAPALETAVKAYAEVHGLKLGKFAQPLRAALTGRAVSPPVFDVMAVLGRDETLARIRDQVGH